MNGNEQINADISSGKGYIYVRVSTADEAIPLFGASVKISNENGNILYNLKSDRSGMTPTVEISTPPGEASSFPNEEKKFALVNIEVTLKGYYTAFFSQAPVFDKITSIQEAKLIPRQEDGKDFIIDYSESKNYSTNSKDL